MKDMIIIEMLMTKEEEETNGNLNKVCVFLTKISLFGFLKDKEVMVFSMIFVQATA